MSIGFLFWMLYVITVVFGGWGYWYKEVPSAPSRFYIGNNLLLLILLFLLGWGTFGFVVRGP